MEQLIEGINFERKPIKWLHDQMSNELLYVDNSFQRRYVWTETNQIQLVESILIGYPIPEIYVWERETDPDSGETKHSIIDGQQRLGAVHDFINNKFRLKGTAIEYKDADYKNKQFSELTEDQRSNLWKYPFAVRFVKSAISLDEIIHMFLRLNKTSTTLNPQELRNASFSGKFLQLAEEVANNNFWERNELFASYDIRRMIDVQFASSILIFFRFGFEEETTQASLNRAYDTFNVEYNDYDLDKVLFFDLIKLVDELIADEITVKKVLQKKTHLYTCFTFLYYLHRAGKTDLIENYRNFIHRYESTENLIAMYGEENADLIREYKELSLEGTQKRINRKRRFEIIKQVIESTPHNNVYSK